MDDFKRQQALDNFRNALGRLDQSDFYVEYVQTDKGFAVYVIGVECIPKIPKKTFGISNHTLRIKNGNSN